MAYIDRKELYWTDPAAGNAEKPLTTDGNIPTSFNNATRMMPAEIQGHRYEDEITTNGVTVGPSAWNYDDVWVDVSDFSEVVALSKGEAGQTNQLQLYWSTDGTTTDYSAPPVTSDNGQYGRVESKVLAKFIKVAVKNNNAGANQILTAKLIKKA